MEFPISFFLDYAWNPEKINAEDLADYFENWAASQFGQNYAQGIAELLTKYAKYNARCKLELLDANTYSLATGDWKTVVEDYNALLRKAEKINAKVLAESRDAYFQLVLHPIQSRGKLPRDA